MEGYIEIEETIKDGRVVKRLINGVEYPLSDGFPDFLRNHDYRGVNLKQFMSWEYAKERYGHFPPPPDTEI